MPGSQVRCASWASSAIRVRVLRLPRRDGQDDVALACRQRGDRGPSAVLGTRLGGGPVHQATGDGRREHGWEMTYSELPVVGAARGLAAILQALGTGRRVVAG